MVRAGEIVMGRRGSVERPQQPACVPDVDFIKHLIGWPNVKRKICLVLNGVLMPGRPVDQGRLSLMKIS